MDFSYTSEQEALKGLARRILEAHAAPESLKKRESGGGWHLEPVWRDLAAAGLFGVAISEQGGGAGLGLIELSILLRELGRSALPLPIWPSLVLGALAIDRFGSTLQRKSILPAVASGDRILTAALLDQGGDDPLRPLARARRSGGGWRLDGDKICVPAANAAWRILVTAEVEGEGACIFIVDPSAKGVTLTQQVATHGEPEHTLKMNGLELSNEDLLDGPDPKRRAIEWMTEHAVVGLAAIQTGIAEKALEMTARYTSERAQFDRPIATFQAVSQRAADMYIDVQAMELTMQQAVWRLSEQLLAAEEVAIAKFWAAEGGHRVTAAAQHLHGGIGFDRDYPLHRYTLWAKANELTLGAASEQLANLGSAIVRKIRKGQR